ncbi:MAG: hypothetical protein ACLFMW_07280 [Ectothiorhodospira sp.]
MTHRATWMAYGIVFLLLAGLYLATMPLTGEARDLWLKEWGIVEVASALGYAACLALIAWRRHVIALWPFVVMIGFFMLRELDFDKQFTTMGIFKSRFYISPEVPLMEKLVGGAILLGLVLTGILILRRYTRPLLSGLRTGSAVAWGGLLAFGGLVLAKSIDGLPRKLDAIGIGITDQTARHAGGFEEVLELGIPLIILLALMAYLRNRWA